MKVFEGPQKSTPPFPPRPIGKASWCIYCLDAHSGTHADYVGLLKLKIEILQREVEQIEQLWQSSLEHNTRMAWTPPASATVEIPLKIVLGKSIGGAVWSAALWIERQLNNLEKALTRSR